MKFDQDGIYTLLYTAEDECGNKTEETRNVEVYTTQTVLYTDGALIINEKSTDRTNNIAVHGQLIKEYAPFSETQPYIFPTYRDSLWREERAQIKNISVGSPINPTSTANWFFGSSATSFDGSNIDSSALTDTHSMFQQSGRLQTAVFSNWDLGSVTNFANMFNGCSVLASVVFPDDSVYTSGIDFGGMFSGCATIETLDLSMFDTKSATTMSGMFYGCKALKSLNIKRFNTQNVADFSNMFAQCDAIEVIDASSFDTRSATNFGNMFHARGETQTNLRTIYASPSFVIPSGASSTNMFTLCAELVGGAGTNYDSSHVDAEYARIDNPPDAPGYFTLKQA